MVAGVQWTYALGGLSQVLLMILCLEQYLADETSVQTMGAGVVSAMGITATLAVMHRRKRHPYSS
jgi:hypothetical protein